MDSDSKVTEKSLAGGSAVVKPQDIALEIKRGSRGRFARKDGSEGGIGRSGRALQAEGERIAEIIKSVEDKLSEREAKKARFYKENYYKFAKVPKRFWARFAFLDNDSSEEFKRFYNRLMYESIQEDAEEPHLVPGTTNMWIVNVVATFSVPPLNYDALWKLELPNLDLRNRTRYLFRMQDPKGTVVFYPSGKSILLGGRSEDSALRAAENAANQVCRSPIQDFEIRNMVCQVKMGSAVNLEDFTERYKTVTIYGNEGNQGENSAEVNLDWLQCTVMLHTTGSATIFGKDIDRIIQAREYTQSMIRNEVFVEERVMLGHFDLPVLAEKYSTHMDTYYAKSGKCKITFRHIGVTAWLYSIRARCLCYGTEQHRIEQAFDFVQNMIYGKQKTT